MSRSLVQRSASFKSLLMLVIVSVSQTKCTTDNDLDPIMDKLPTYSETTRFMRTKCAQNGGDEAAFLALKNQTFAMLDCLQKSFDYETMEQELTNAAFVDDVVQKYCKKFPIFENCVAGTVSKAKPCLDKKEMQSLNTTLDLVRAVKDFMCYRNGFRLSFFMVFDGQNCTHLRHAGIQKCLQAAYEEKMQNGTSSRIIVDETLCPDVIKLRTCVVDEFLKCKKSTPASVIEAGFKVVQRKLDCYKNCGFFASSNLNVIFLGIALSKLVSRI